MTVAVPTHNRATLLRRCLESVLAQDFPAFEVIVLDNASEDETQSVVASLSAHGRVAYERTDEVTGAIRNWNRAIDRNASPYLCVFCDDDLMLPGFLRHSVEALEACPTAGLSFTSVGLVDLDGEVLGSQDPGDVAPGCSSGLDYLERAVAGRRLVINPSATVMRQSALTQVGRFSSPHSSLTFDFNLHLRIAAGFDVVFLPEELVEIRVHAGQLYEKAWRAEGATGPFADTAERLDAASYLLESPRAAAPEYRKWLAGRVRTLNSARSNAALPFAPALHSWEDRVAMAIEDIVSVVPEGASIVLVDDDHWAGHDVPQRRTIPFLERDGESWGPPADSETAISELERLRAGGATFVAFAWSAFWWLDHYRAFETYLRSVYRCPLGNDRVVAFDLTQRTDATMRPEAP